TLSQPSENWKKTRGRVSEHLTLLPEARYFICGNPEMVKDVRAQLLEKAVPVTNIHLEIF
ncbi:MAG: oxidoreductase, partial [Candidatus Magasanikbacteria bacterium]|nr:oxidoreductase [Candidatus Magasanikbacteria bacterium]